MHFPHCPSPSVNGCVSPVSWYDPSQNLLLMPSSGIFLRCATLTFLISLELLEFSLSFSVSLSFMPSSLTFSLYLLCFLSPSCSSKPDQLALDGFLLAPVRPDFTLSSLDLSAGREQGDRSLIGSQMDADMLGMRVVTGLGSGEWWTQPQLSLTKTEGVRCVLCCCYYYLIKVKHCADRDRRTIMPDCSQEMEERLERIPCRFAFS